MTKQPNLIAKGKSLALLIRKHGGWLDDNDKDVVRFPTPHALAMFMKELDAEKQKENRMTPKVTKHTRAPRDGRMIYCPKCGVGHLSYNFAWIGGTCQSCWQMVDKLEYFLEPPQRKELPRKLPPTFKADADDYWTLYNGDGSYSGIAVELKAPRPAWGPCEVIDNGKRHAVDTIANAKTLAIKLLKGRSK